jgi:hypothetical protein
MPSEDPRKMHRQPAWSVCHCSQVLYAFFGCGLECMLNGGLIGVIYSLW